MKRKLALVLAVLAALALVGVLAFRSQLAPQPAGQTWLVRFDDSKPLSDVLSKLQDRKIIKSAGAMGLYASWRRSAKPVSVGTYRFKSGADAEAVLKQLRTPIRQMVRIPEVWWIARTAERLEANGVCKAQDYIDLAHKPKLFQNVVSFPLPKDSLEGYLYPDTYDLPPLLGAKNVIERQLKTFETRFLKGRKAPKNLHYLVTVASMVQLEAAKDAERPRIAGVIENRLDMGMALQIDATINYALQKWRPLAVSEYQSVDSPYNTYRNKGIPPGPICSPSLASLKAAEKPENHRWFFYVAKATGGTHMFAETYAEHLRNVAKRRADLKTLKP